MVTITLGQKNFNESEGDYLLVISQEAFKKSKTTLDLSIKERTKHIKITFNKIFDTIINKIFNVIKYKQNASFKINQGLEIEINDGKNIISFYNSDTKTPKDCEVVIIYSDSDLVLSLNFKTDKGVFAIFFDGQGEINEISAFITQILKLKEEDTNSVCLYPLEELAWQPKN